MARRFVIASRAGTGQRDMVRRDVRMAPQRCLMRGLVHKLSQRERWRQSDRQFGMADQDKQLGRCRGRPQGHSQRASHIERHGCTVARPIPANVRGHRASAALPPVLVPAVIRGSGLPSGLITGVESLSDRSERPPIQCRIPALLP